jgi:hypothetical protein
LGTEFDRDRLPTTTWVIDSTDIDRTGIPTLRSAILERIPSATVNATDGNEFQPDVLFRGFTAKRRIPIRPRVAARPSIRIKAAQNSGQ